MSSYPKHLPKHRAASTRRVPRAAIRTTLTLSSMAVLATGFAVGGGSLSLSAAPPASSGDLTTSGTTLVEQAAEVAGQVGTAAAAAGATEAEARTEVVTRSESRKTTDPLKETTLSVGGDNAMARSEDLSDEDPRDIARALLAEYGWPMSQFGCLDSLWERESHWNPLAENPSSGAYGIPQSLPGTKMATIASDWRTNPITQIRWGLGYIQDRYGSPCGAWGHSESHGWY